MHRARRRPGVPVLPGEGDVANLVRAPVAVGDEHAAVGRDGRGLATVAHPPVDLGFLDEPGIRSHDRGAQRHVGPRPLVVVLVTRAFSPVEPDRANPLRVRDQRDEAVLGGGAVAMRDHDRAPAAALVR